MRDLCGGSPQPINSFIVDDAGDAEDADPTDGVCATNTGACTLRAAIEQANAWDNATDSMDVISFNIPDDGPHRIQPTSPLPPIMVPVFIDGTTQPGFDGATNTLSIELDGSLAGDKASGLTISAGNSTIQGLMINNFRNNGVAIPDEGLANTIQDNSIFGNLLNGILVSGSSTANEIRGNSIYSNNSLGIDLGGDGVTPNDLVDEDTGANNLQNAPEISSAVTEAQSTTITGSLNSAPGKTFTLEFFANTDCHALGFGEGKTSIGSITTETDALGDASFEFVPPVAQEQGVFITATATDLDGNTSEFSACVMTK